MSFITYASIIAEGFTSISKTWRIRKEIHRHITGLIYLDVVGLGSIEQTFGRHTCDQMITLLKKCVSQIHELGVALTAERVIGDDFYLFIKIPEGFGSLQKLFVNVDSRSMAAPSFTLQHLLTLTSQEGLTPHDIVIEITERNFVSDYKTFTEVLAGFRNAGFAIAVDDAGMGYSSLHAITELMPDYIKIDKSLIRYIDRELVKALMVESLVDFAKKINCTVIAEGIETEEELAKVIQLGVQYGQGYLLAKPHPTLVTVSHNALDLIRLGGQNRFVMYPEMTSVGDLVHDAKVFQEDIRVADVAQYFNQHETETTAIVLRGTRPVGLVMRDKLLRNLATQYGVPLYWRKEIRHLMDPNPLIVEATISIETTSRLSMNRDSDKVYDSVIVTELDRFMGIVTIQDILSAMNTFQLERARDSNPLTGLPGNQGIERELKRRITTGQPFHILYADIDYFKWFNDKYGFVRGDSVILIVADVLTQVCQDDFHSRSFIGHIGGDDFVVITDDSEHEPWWSEIIHRFDQGIRRFYGDDSAAEVSFDAHPIEEVLDRQGNPVPTQGLTLSLSLLACPNSVNQSISLAAVNKEVALLKKAAKAQRGSTCVRGVMGAYAL